VQTAIGADSMAPLVFGGTSCSSPRALPFPVHGAAAARDDLDFFIHAGDHIYADLLGPAAVTIAQYRATYSEVWASSGMRSLHGSTGQYLTWDDHEVFNNWNPESISRGRLAAATQAFFEHRATRRNADDRDRIWRSFRWGRTAEIFILDCRGERRPSTRSEDPSRSSTYISRRQMDWLKAGLRSSPCVFKFIVNSVPIVDRAGADGDNWNGYASQRREILNHIDNNRLRGVVWLSGDVHFGGVCRVEAAGPWADIWEVVMGPAGSNRDGRPPIRPAQWPVLVNDVHNFVLFHADPATRTLTVDFINGSGDRIPGSRWTHTF
jgi:phosphodiesterase/alkaline phosphatase D-like protein